MKRTLGNIFFGKGTFLNGLIILLILGSIVLGCTCNKGFGDLGTKKDTNSSKDEDKKPSKKERVYDKADASKGEIPSEDELQDIVKADLLAFDKALKDKDFDGFYSRISKVWKDETTAAELKDKFQAFIDGKADLSGVADLDANFSPKPSIDDTKRVKILEVNGTYPTKPKTSDFEIKYMPEGKDWKLIGFFVKTTIYKKQ